MKKEVIKIYKECPICGKTFKMNEFGRPQKFCSPQCQWKDANNKKKERRVIEKKCEYCGKIFNGNKKQKYCSSECAKKANNDMSSMRKSYLWYNNIEFRKQKVLKHKGGLGTVELSENKDNDWEKELIRIRALKKQAGLNKKV
jgi:endogenous inhibitor of DNA gyrase (YacG/DUF329 family)